MTQPPQQPEPSVSSGPTVELPSADAPAPPKSRARMITASIVAAVLVLGGAGVGIYLATRDEDPVNNAAANPSTTSTRPPVQTAPSESGGASNPPGANPTGTAPAPSDQPQPPAPGDQPAAVDPAVLDTAQRYAKAVTDKDEATAKSLSCDTREAGILFDEGVKVEVIGKTQMLDANSATIDVKVTIEQAEPLEGFPLLLNKAAKGWCVT